MIQANEILNLILFLGVLFFILKNRPELNRLPALALLMGGFHMLVLAAALTIVEGFFWEAALNVLEHVCYAAGALLMAIWCGLVFTRRRSGQ